MSKYVQKRIDYINNWPNSELFPAEQNYKQRCKNFIATHNKFPFQPVKMWLSQDDTYNRAISHLIDSLDMMPNHPNFSFLFIFSGLDFFSKQIYSSNITSNLKQLIADLSLLSQKSENVKKILEMLFSVFPVNTSQYLYQCLYGNSNHNMDIRKRIYTDQDGLNVNYRKNVIDLVFNKYGYDTTNYSESIRNGALLYRKMFLQDTVNINNQTITVSNEFRLYLLLCGVIYSLRNDAMHGSSMSSTKSSLTTPERYASNYYCFLATYTLFMIMLIMQSINDLAEQERKYTALKVITLENVQNFRLLFGNHIK